MQINVFIWDEYSMGSNALQAHHGAIVLSFLPALCYADPSRVTSVATAAQNLSKLEATGVIESTFIGSPFSKGLVAMA